MKETSPVRRLLPKEQNHWIDVEIFKQLNGRLPNKDDDGELEELYRAYLQNCKGKGRCYCWYCENRLEEIGEKFD